jgi:PAS domain S-box-containing protein
MPRRSVIWWAVIAALLAAIFTVEAVTPLGFAHGTLYVPVVLLTILLGRTAPVWLSAIAGIVLTLAGLFVSPGAPSDFPPAMVVANRAGSIIALLVTLAVGLLLVHARRDLTAANADLRSVQEALTENVRLLEMAADVGRLGAWRLRLEDRQVTWSEDSYRILGLPPGSQAGMAQIGCVASAEGRERIAESVDRCARDCTPFDLEIEVSRPDGDRVWVRAIGRASRDDEGRVVAIEGAIQDITRLKRIELESRELTQRLTATLESLADPFFILDSRWRIVYVNSHSERLAGATSDALIGRDFWEVYPGTRESEFGRHYLEAARSRTRRHFRARSAMVDRWLDVSVYPTPDGGLAVHLRDVTEQQRLEAALQQAQRLDSIGQLTGGVAHDFNNLLTVILGNADLLRDRLDDGGLRPLADMIVGAAESGAQLTLGLLAFARRQVLAPRPVDVNEQVAAMDGLLRRTLGEHVELECVRGAGLWPALVDPAQLENALLNLCLNARDAMPGGGRLTIETANVRIGDDYVAQHPEAQPGQYVLLAVSDTGMGIPSEHLDRIFEPFFTTKDKNGNVGQGSGLGLAMVYGFIRQSRGLVNVYSEPGQGTTVKIYLPRASQPVEALPQGPPPGMPGGSEHVLVVEDDEAVRCFAADQLRDLGYRVTEAANGPEALASIDAGLEFDLLFTDVVMPGGLNGRQLADAVRERRPGVRVLFTSGYTENAIVHHGRLDPGVQLLAKPYRRDELARRVRAVLDAAKRDGD